MRCEIVSEFCPIVFQLSLNKEFQAILKNEWKILNVQFSTSYNSMKEQMNYSALICYE